MGITHRVRRRLLGLHVALGIVGAVAACVGEDPPAATPSGPDAGITADAAPAADAPVAPDAAASPVMVTDLAAGVAFGCAALSDGSVMCWGQNDLGQIAQSPVDDLQCGPRPCRLPTRVAGLSDVVRVAAGETSACAVTRAGDLYCWGANDHGQLGHPSASDETCPGGVKCNRTPVKVAGLSAIVEVALGAEAGCAVDRAGVVSCWGANEVGQLGRGTLSTVEEPPKAVPGFADGGVVHIAGSLHDEGHLCASTATGQVFCWGQNTSAELGFAATSSPTCGDAGERCTAKPTRVNRSNGTPFDGIESLAVSAAASCVALVGGDVWCWGYNGYAIANEPNTASHAPTLVTTGLSGIAGANSSVCGLASGGTVRCWGLNDDGELGASPATTTTPCAGGAVCSFTPVTVPKLHAVKLSANRHLALGLTADGKLYGWGTNVSAALGHLPTAAETTGQCQIGDSFQPCSPTPVEILPPR